MKKVILSLVLLMATVPALAQHHGHRHGHGHGYWHRGPGGWNWVVPAVIGGAIVYGATRPATVVVDQPPVIVQNPPVVAQQNCSPWTEVQNPDGTITRTRTCQQ